MRKYPNKYYDLHVHTMGSLLDGVIKTKELAKIYKEGGAVTDHGQVFELIDFYKEMKKEGKKPILGVEVYTDNFLNSINNCEMDNVNKKKNYHLVLLAKNNNGLKNIFKMVTMANKNQRDKKPIVTFENFNAFNNDIVVLSGCLGSELSRYLIEKDYESAKKLALYFKETFGEDYYIEIQRHNLEEEKIVNPQLIKLSKEINVKLVATSDAHYLYKEDKEIHDILLCIGIKKTLKDKKRFKFKGENYHLPTIPEMEDRFNDLPQALDSTVDIFEKCNVEIYFPKGNIEDYHVPKVNIPNGYDEEEYFKELCIKGFKERFGSDATKYNNEEYTNRLMYEIKTIVKMKYVSYFLILKEIIDIANSLGIYVGPGRGSAAGSLVANCLGITDIDPLEFGLIFERFLNEKRISMPDIDLDFEDSRRDELIQAIKDRKGEEYVSQIATFGTLGARESIRSIVRVLNYDYSFGDSISKAIPSVQGITIEQALNQSKELKNMYENDIRVKEVIEYSKKIEGLKRNLGTHAAGVVIADKPIYEYLPLANVDGNWITQMYMNTVEEIGLLKMDLLGLKTLTQIRESLENINKKYKTNPSKCVDYKKIPIYDVNVYKEIIAKTNTDNVFQLESMRRKSFMKELYSDILSIDIENLAKQEKENLGKECFKRLIAGLSLYRPGPMESIPQYIKNIKNPSNIKYAHPLLKDILEDTYGVIIYQEQVMSIVQVLAGYSLGDADIIRRAMGKKDMEMMKKHRKIFIYGEFKCPKCKSKKYVENKKCDYCNGEGYLTGDNPHNKDDEFTIKGALANGVREDICNEIFDLMIEFSKYAFNKSHAASYAILAIKTAYLKCYYPLEFMISNLNCAIGDSKKLKHYLDVCKKMNIRILPPCVSNSNAKFKEENESDIRFGLEGIKHLGKVSHLIEKERLVSGEFETYQNFVERMSICDGLDKTMLEATIYSGALDVFEGSRRAKLSILDTMLKIGKDKKENKKTGQISLFDIEYINNNIKDNIQSMKLKEATLVKTPDLEEFDKIQKLNYEKEYAGLYISEHLLDDYKDFINKFDLMNILDIVNEMNENGKLNLKGNNNETNIIGLLKNCTLRYSNKGKLYMTGKIEDSTYDIDFLIFEDILKKFKDTFIDNNVVIFNGSIEKDDFGIKIKVYNAINATDIVKKSENLTKSIKKVTIKIEDSINREKLKYLNNLFFKYKGDTEVTIVDKDRNMFRYNGFVNVNNPFFIIDIDKILKEKYKII